MATAKSSASVADTHKKHQLGETIKGSKPIVLSGQASLEKKMKKLIILIEIIIIVLLLYVLPKAEAEPKYYLMTTTAYSNDPQCISDKWRDGKTAMNTPIREGVCAINVDYINGEWIVKSPLKLGNKIYIEELGYFSVEDTGYFTDKNYKQDYWNVDIYMEDYQEAIEYGRKLKKIYILNMKGNK